METSTTPVGKAMTGQQLEQLMDRLEADLEESNSNEAIGLLARLRAQPLRAGSLAAIARLHGLWMRAGDAVAARAVLDADGASLLQTSPSDSHADIRMQLALYRLQIACSLREDDATHRALDEMLGVVKNVPGLDGNRYRHLQILDSIERDRLDHALQASELRHALNCSIASRAAFRAWDEADYQGRRAWTFHRQKRAAEACAAADAAIAALKTASADQDVDASDWLRIGDALIEIAPHQLATLQQAVAAATASWSLPQRREAEVRLARLAARALRAQGDLHGALDACAGARYSLDSCGGDDFDFIEHELPWLLEAGRIEEAGRRAFFDIYRTEADMWPGTAQVVHTRLADATDDSVWWPLCVMQACRTPKAMTTFLANTQDLLNRSPVHRALFGAMLGGTDQSPGFPVTFAAARALAEQRSPGHPWIRRLAAVKDAEAGHIDAATQVGQLQAAAQDGRMEDDRTAQALFVARVEAFGLVETLKLPAPSLPSGLWSYRFANWIGQFVEERLDSFPAESRDEVRTNLKHLQETVYEHGRACMERFFEAGNGGHPYDACAHLYSMLCNNLAIIYCVHDRRYQDAIDLHACGIAASPFAEHYSGILWARIKMKDFNGIVVAAEQLWHYAAEFGFSRHDPNRYVNDVAEALHELGRDREILIWLERIVKWQREEQQVEEAHLPRDALNARLRVADFLAYTRPDEATTLWQSLRSQVDTNSSWWTITVAADLMHRLGRRTEAVPLYERALGLNPGNTYIEKRLAFYRQEAQPQVPAQSVTKSWWQFWK